MSDEEPNESEQKPEEILNKLASEEEIPKFLKKRGIKAVYDDIPEGMSVDCIESILEIFGEELMEEFTNYNECMKKLESYSIDAEDEKNKKE